MLSSVLEIIYFIGIASCGMQGSEKSSKKSVIVLIIARYFASLGGGLLRDVFFLRVHPFALSWDCWREIVIAEIIGMVYSRVFMSKKYSMRKAGSIVVCFTDALGLGTFISAGIDKAISLNAGPTIAVCCGVITAIGGGMLTSLICGCTIQDVLKGSLVYRFITIMSAIFYYKICNTNAMEQPIAEASIVIFAFLCIMVSMIDFRKLNNTFQSSTVFLPYCYRIMALYFTSNPYIIENKNTFQDIIETAYRVRLKWACTKFSLEFDKPPPT